MIKTKEDLDIQVTELKRSIWHCTVDMLNDIDELHGVKKDIVKAIIMGVERWKRGMEIIIEEESEQKCQRYIITLLFSEHIINACLARERDL